MEDLPSRPFTSEEVEWIARLSGRTSTGSVPDRGAPLLHLTFYRASEPRVAVREALVPGTSIDDFLESGLIDVLSVATDPRPADPAPSKHDRSRRGEGGGRAGASRLPTPPDMPG